MESIQVLFGQQIHEIAFIRFLRMFSCMLGIILLFIIWKDTSKRANADQSDFGYLMIISALLIWVFIDWSYLQEATWRTNSVKKVLSTANNFLLLMSLPYFNHGFPFLRKKYNLKYLNYGIATIGLIISAFIGFKWGLNNAGWLSNIDKVITLVTYSLLGIALIRSFHKRGYNYIISILLIIIFSVLIITQYVLDGKEQTMNYGYLFYICSQIGFILIMILHALSWQQEVILNNVSREEYEASMIEKSERNKKISELEEKLVELEAAKEQEIKTLQEDLDKRTQIKLSDAEIKIFKLIDKGSTRIARILGKDVNTVNSQIKDIRNKYGVKTKKELVQIAKNKGVIKNK